MDERELINFFRSEADRSEIVIKLDDPEKGVSPGQVAVLWDIDDEWVLGCGVITGVMSS